MKTEPKKSVGRPALSDERARKSAKSVSLPAYVWDYLAALEGGRSENVEYALNKAFKIPMPK